MEPSILPNGIFWLVFLLTLTALNCVSEPISWHVMLIAWCFCSEPVFAFLEAHIVFIEFQCVGVQGSMNLMNECAFNQKRIVFLFVCKLYMLSLCLFYCRCVWLQRLHHRPLLWALCRWLLWQCTHSTDWQPRRLLTLSLSRSHHLRPGAKDGGCGLYQLSVRPKGSVAVSLCAICIILTHKYSVQH